MKEANDVMVNVVTINRKTGAVVARGGPLKEGVAEHTIEMMRESANTKDYKIKQEEIDSNTYYGYGVFPDNDSPQP